MPFDGRNDKPGRLPSEDLRQWLTSDDAPRVLDVRSPAEFAAVHIPGSYNVPLDLLREHRDELREHLDEVVLVCRSGARADQAEKLLAETGLRTCTSSTAASSPGCRPAGR